MSSFSRANQRWWDSDANNYHSSHSAYLSSFYWCPEMLHEKDARLLGDVHGKHVLEIGCGSAPCISWLAAAETPALAVGFDLSAGMLAHARREASLVQADALAFPFATASFDVVFSAFGALPFVDSSLEVFREVTRVLRPGGRFVMSINHPMRWIFLDDPGPAGLTAVQSYFDRSPYVEYSPDGQLEYAEQHRTVGDRIRELVAAGFVLNDLIEPEWPSELEESWGQWSPLRGKIFPGTAIFVATRS